MNARTLLILMAVACLAASGASASDARRLMERGLSTYREARYSDAAQLFEQAAEQADETALEPEFAHLNRGNALYRLELWEDAAAAYEQARISPDLDIQAAALFNLGNTAMQQADHALENAEGTASLEHLERALTSYARALLLDPVSMDVKINRELAQRARTGLLERVQRVKEALVHALAQVDERDYQGALDTLQGVSADTDLAFSLEPDLENPYVETMQRLGNILEIQRMDDLPMSQTVPDAL